MLITNLLGVLLEALTVASVAAAAILLVLKLMRPAQAPLPVEGHGWFRRDNLRALAWAVLAAVGSRVLLAALAYAALALVNQFGTIETQNLLEKYGLAQLFPPLWSLFNRWDGPHYIDIARFGYTSSLSANGGEQHWFIVFYPLYPALIALIKPLLGNEFNAATILSWGCLAGACYWLYRLSAFDNDKPEARRAVKYLLIFPAAVFLGAPYTESLFLLLTVLCLYALRRGRWWLAAVLGFFAAMTRNLGVLLVVPYALELADRLGAFSEPQRLWTGRFWREFLRHGAWMLLMPLGMGVYLLINQLAYGDPLMFLKIQSDHWGQRAQPFWQTVLTTWNCLVGDRPHEEKLFLWAPQLGAMVAMLLGLPFLTRKLRPSYAAYLIVYTAVALSPSWLLSFTRYMMGCVPLFLGLAALGRRRWADRTMTIVFTALMLFLAAGFVMWMMVV